MLFNSFDFLFFLPFCILVFHAIPNEKLLWRNSFLLAMSLIFYGWWNPKFLILLASSAVIDFWVGILIDKTSDEKRRKYLLAISLTANLGMLVFFKYSNFFIESFCDAFSFFGSKFQIDRLNIILPVGISFYTFQTMSYTIDVYKRKLKATNNLIDFASFVAFFPQLVAGPIERATHLLGQFQTPRKVSSEDWTEGFKQILWGFFKKLVVADNCAILVNQIFSNSSNYSGITLFSGGFFFAFQIYGDFSGYSDIAIGSARLFGFRLMQNFKYPYFSRDIAEFWRRWHISLSTWFRDYLYIPLGGSRTTLKRQIRNTFLVFFISGFWHGANWTYILWGVSHAFLFVPLLIGNKNRSNIEFNDKISFLDTFRMLSTFIVVSLLWILFRSPSIDFAIRYYIKIFSFSFFSWPEVYSLKVLFGISLLILLEWNSRFKHYPLESMIFGPSKIFRFAIYIFLILIIYFLGNNDSSIEFIYFQF